MGEYKHDMAKLNEVKARREAAASKAAAQKEASESAVKQRKKAVEAAEGSDDEEGGGKKKKKKGKSNLPKIDKIAVKKMKPAQLKEALKERDLEIQGNAKVLQA